MNSDEAQQIIDLAYSQWPKLSPDPQAVIIWTAALAGHDFEQASRAVIVACRTASMPPAIADVLAVLEPDQTGDPDTDWPAVARLLAAGRFAQELNPADFPTDTAYRAARSVQWDLRMASAEQARWIFRRAYTDATDTPPPPMPSLNGATPDPELTP